MKKINMRITGHITRKNHFYYEKNMEMNPMIVLTVETINNEEIDCLCFGNRSIQLNEEFEVGFCIIIEGNFKSAIGKYNDSIIIDTIENQAFQNTGMEQIMIILKASFHKMQERIEIGNEKLSELILDKDNYEINEYGGTKKHYNELLARLNEYSERIKLCHDVLSFKNRPVLTAFPSEISLRYDTNANFLHDKYFSYENKIKY